tara:strand:+ start:588 stop:1067 length:480 start_codon:yes stop_codon:yes gene_type:complete
MKILQLNKTLIITLSVLTLVGCDNYEFVNTDQYHLIKKDEVKYYNGEIKWDGLNISTKVTAKYLDGRFYYKLLVEDLGGGPLQETDYYEALRQGTLRLIIYDKDNFEIENEIPIKVTEMYNQIGQDGKTQVALVLQGSIQMQESKYLKIETITVGTLGI